LHGTRRYVAPESFKAGSTANARLDLYALGVILAEMLADAPDTPVALATYTRALQAADPQARSPTAAAVIEELQQILVDGDRSTAGATQQPPLRPPPRPASSRVVRWVASITALLAAGALTSAVRVGQVPPRAGASAPLAPPPPLRVPLQAFTQQNQLTMPKVPLPDVIDREPAVRATPARPRPAGPSTRTELEAALLERRQQMSRAGLASVDVSAVDDIRFDPSRRSARVIYRRQGSTAEVVEYWVLRDGRWQALDD
jgi:hypothetical protein